MMKRMILTLTLILCAVMLCACSGGDSTGTRYDVVNNSDAQATQNVFGNGQSGVVAAAVTQPPVITQAPAVNYDYSYSANTPVPTVRSEYAGATPVVIDPIDKPTPTPLPALVINYETYDATALHLSFDGPVGWTIDDSSSDSYTITDPGYACDFNATLTVSVIPVSENYTESQLKTEVTTRLSALKSTFYTFSSTKTASRTLLDKSGVYADYSATLSSGVSIKGRIHVTCVGKKLYVFQMETPAGYFDTYKDSVYTKFRHTVKITQ